MTSVPYVEKENFAVASPRVPAPGPRFVLPPRVIVPDLRRRFVHAEIVVVAQN